MMSRKERRWRCSTHQDYLLKPGDRCPWCKILKLEEQLEIIRVREEMFKGKDVMLALHSSFDRILEPILRTLGFKNVRSHMQSKDLKEIRIGGFGDHTSYYVVPENTAKAMIEIADEAQRHLIEAMYYEVQNVRNRIESSIVSDLSGVVNEIVDGDVSERSLAEAIVREIFYNDSKIGYDGQEKMSKKAIKAVKGIIDRHAIAMGVGEKKKKRK
jgi:hypothetical protein